VDEGVTKAGIDNITSAQAIQWLCTLVTYAQRWCSIVQVLVYSHRDQCLQLQHEVGWRLHHCFHGDQQPGLVGQCQSYTGGGACLPFGTDSMLQQGESVQHYKARSACTLLCHAAYIQSSDACSCCVSTHQSYLLFKCKVKCNIMDLLACVHA